MADTMRNVSNFVQPVTAGDRLFTGMDAYMDPNKLEEGNAQRITNLVLQNGSLVPRKGFQSVVTNAIAGSYWASLAVKTGRNIASSAILAADSGTGSTRFWKYDSNHIDSLPIPMSSTGTTVFSNIQPNLVRMAQHGRYVYVAPGQAASGSSNLPLRIDTKISSVKLTNVTIGTNLLTKANHGLSVGDAIVITSVVSGTLPGALSTNTAYFVTHVTTNDFYVASSLPTTTTASVSHITFAAPSPTCTVEVATTFKGETVPTVTGLLTTAPVPELFPYVVKDISATAHQTVTTSLTLSSSNQMLSNSTFTDSNDVTPASWTQFTGTNTITVKTLASNSGMPRPSTGNAALFDENSVSGVLPGIWQEVSVPTETYNLYASTGSNTVVEGSSLYALQIRMVHFEGVSSPRRRPVNVRIIAKKSSGGSWVDIPGALVSQRFDLNPNDRNPDQWSVFTMVADFRSFKDELGTTGKIRVEVQNAASFGDNPRNYEGLYVDYVYLHPIPCVPKTSTTDTAVDPNTKLVKIYATKVNSATSPAAPDYGGYLKQRHFYYDVSATTNDWQSVEYVSCQFYLNPRFASQNPTFTIGIQNASETSIRWGTEGSYDEINQYLTFSLVAFPKAFRNNVKAVYIRCNNDFLVSNTTGSVAVNTNEIVFYIGKLVYNGQLQSGGKYEYAFTRWKCAPSYTTNTTTASFTQSPPYSLNTTTMVETFFGGIESALSKVSTSINTTNAQSRARVSLAGAFRDASGDGYTHLLVYRRNVNAFTDGKFRLIAQIDIYPATPVLVSSPTGASLESGATQSQIYLIDDVGDADLLFDGPIGKAGCILREGKDFFPAACETVAVHQQRLWMSKGNTLYASWLLDNDNEYALHTTLVPIAGDPYLPIKGASFDIGGDFDNEPIVSLVPFSGEGMSRSNSTTNALLVLRNNSLFPVTGNDASNFAVLGFVKEPGSGCIAPRCAQTVEGHVWWMSNAGIHQYVNGLPQRVSKQLDRLVNARQHNPLYNPTTGNLVIDQNLQQNSCSAYFDNKFLFASAQPGSTQINTIFVYDTSMQGWCEWSFPNTAGNQPRSMYVLDTGTDAPDLYVAASNGRIYKYTGTVDRLTESAGTESAFTWALLSRQYGQTYAQGQAYYTQNKISQFDFHIESTAPLTVNWKVYNQNQPQYASPVFNTSSYSFYSSGAWSMTAGNKSIAVRNIMKDMRGTNFSIELSGSSPSSGNSFRIYGILAHMTDAGIRRTN